jgi:hypothetical protein
MSLAALWIGGPPKAINYLGAMIDVASLHLRKEMASKSCFGHAIMTAVYNTFPYPFAPRVKRDIDPEQRGNYEPTQRCFFSV